MEIIPEPVVAKRTWIYSYKPGSWPPILRKGWPEGNRPDKTFEANELRIAVFQRNGAAPELDTIYVNGRWPNGNPVRMVRVHHDASPEQGLIVHAPEWVMTLAADAVRRSMREASR